MKHISFAMNIILAIATGHNMALFASEGVTIYFVALYGLVMSVVHYAYYRSLLFEARLKSAPEPTNSQTQDERLSARGM